MKSDLNADFISQKTPHYKRDGRRGFSPEHDTAQPPYRIRRTGYGGRADKQCPNRSPLIAFARHGLMAMVAKRDVGVFGHAAVERGGGGGKWTAVVAGARAPQSPDRRGRPWGARAEPRKTPRSDQNKYTIAEPSGLRWPERAHGRQGTSYER